MANEIAKSNITESEINASSRSYDNFNAEFNLKPNSYCPFDYMKHKLT